MTITNTSERSQITVDGLPWKFDSFAGDESSWETQHLRPAAGEPMMAFYGRVSHTDVVLSSFLRPVDQVPTLNRWRADIDVARGFSVARQYLDPDGVPVPGAVTVWTGCAVKGVAIGDHDANSTEPVKVTVTLSVGEIAA